MNITHLNVSRVFILNLLCGDPFIKKIIPLDCLDFYLLDSCKPADNIQIYNFYRSFSFINQLQSALHITCVNQASHLILTVTLRENYYILILQKIKLKFQSSKKLA